MSSTQETLQQQLKDFDVVLADGSTQQLKNMLGRNATVVYFYPKSSTPGCTKQSCALRDDFSHLHSVGISVIGVTKDKPSKIQKFIDQENLNFPIISDEKLALIQYFEVWKEKKFMGKTYMGIERSSFIFDANGDLLDQYRNVKVSEHLEWIHSTLKHYYV